MQRVNWLAALGAAGWLALASAAQAQVRPYIGFVYPAGGQQGTTFQIKLGGQGLEDVKTGPWVWGHRQVSRVSSVSQPPGNHPLERATEGVETREAERRLADANLGDDAGKAARGAGRAEMRPRRN